MKSLKDKYCGGNIKEFGYFDYTDVKEAFNELLLRQEIKPVKDFNKNSVSMKYIKVKDLIEIIGDFEE